YSESEFTRVNLLDIFVGLDRDSFAELTKPLYDGSQGTVYYNGSSQRQDLTTYPIEARLQLSTVEDPPILIVNVQDVSERAKWEDKLVYQANNDQLTGLYNRHYMQFFMDSAFVRARRARHKVVLLFIDLDNFKVINDTLGHDAGDELLKQTAQRIRMLLRESDTPARTGGDEFTIMLEGLEETSHAEIVARKLVGLFEQPFTFEGREIFTSASIGISVYPDDGKTLDQLMKYADMAMYQTKECGRNNYRFFSQEMCRISEEQILITNHLRGALAKGEFSLAYQPQVDIVEGRIVGAEALLRWHNPDLGEVPPDKFISLAENMGFIENIGSWVLETACCEAKHWQDFSSHDLRVSVNVSPQQFRAGTLFDTVERILQKSGLPANLLELEITESLLLQDSDRPINVLQRLADRGVSLALDDFGTGYS
ncbi:MAG: diguanylate cyclase, partial [Deltaproteobacteria bacterium]|nr:diguanylate cyclase [Deltaproteobacteria bacterium]